MSWAKSLIKLSTYEVETLQKRLGEISDRRMAAEMKLIMLEAEAESEAMRLRQHPDQSWGHAAFMDGVRYRRGVIQVEIERIMIEEAGARDALAQAFEEQKKYEQVAENQRLQKLKVQAQLETAALDELGLRRAAGGR